MLNCVAFGLFSFELLVVMSIPVCLFIHAENLCSLYLLFCLYWLDNAMVISKWYFFPLHLKNFARASHQFLLPLTLQHEVLVRSYCGNYGQVGRNIFRHYKLELLAAGGCTPYLHNAMQSEGFVCVDILLGLRFELLFWGLNGYCVQSCTKYLLTLQKVILRSNAVGVHRDIREG